MGVKIEKAVYTKKKEEITHIEADKQELNKEKFTCVYCGKELKFRVSGKRRLEDRTIDISPYFYLVKGREHGENCKYNTFGQIEIIARKPMTLKDFMKKKKPNQYAIRLQVVKDAMAEAPVEEEENTNSKPKDKKDTPEIEYKNVGTMAPYLSRMKDIMILRSRMEKNNDIKKHLKLEYNNNTISWDKFYYGPEDVDFLELSKYFRGNPKPKHPVCIEGVVKGYEPKTDKKGRAYYSFKLAKTYVKDIHLDGFKHVPNVSVNIYDENETLINFMKKNYKKNNNQIILYGNPSIKIGQQSNVKYHNIIIWINRTAQVHLFNDIFDK